MTEFPTLSDTSVNLRNPYPFISLKPEKVTRFRRCPPPPPCIGRGSTLPHSTGASTAAYELKIDQ